jgi:endonuclease III
MARVMPAIVTKATRRPAKVKWPPDPLRVRSILNGLEELYPDVDCELDRETPFQLLCATILSAQCTDERVNQVTPASEGIVVDTHVQRLAMRLGLTRATDVKNIESDLMAVIPRDRWIRFSHQLIWHGRRVCFARKPACGSCALAPFCPSAGLER